MSAEKLAPSTTNNQPEPEADQTNEGFLLRPISIVCTGCSLTFSSSCLVQLPPVTEYDTIEADLHRVLPDAGLRASMLAVCPDCGFAGWTARFVRSSLNPEILPEPLDIPYSKKFALAVKGARARGVDPLEIANIAINGMYCAREAGEAYEAWLELAAYEQSRGIAHEGLLVPATGQDHLIMAELWRQLRKFDRAISSYDEAATDSDMCGELIIQQKTLAGAGNSDPTVLPPHMVCLLFPEAAAATTALKLKNGRPIPRYVVREQTESKVEAVFGPPTRKHMYSVASQEPSTPSAFNPAGTAAGTAVGAIPATVAGADFGSPTGAAAAATAPGTAAIGAETANQSLTREPSVIAKANQELKRDPGIIPNARLHDPGSAGGSPAPTDPPSAVNTTSRIDRSASSPVTDYAALSAAYANIDEPSGPSRTVADELAKQESVNRPKSALANSAAAENFGEQGTPVSSNDLKSKNDSGAVSRVKQSIAIPQSASSVSLVTGVNLMPGLAGAANVSMAASPKNPAGTSAKASDSPVARTDSSPSKDAGSKNEAKAGGGKSRDERMIPQPGDTPQDLARKRALRRALKTSPDRFPEIQITDEDIFESLEDDAQYAEDAQDEQTTASQPEYPTAPVAPPQRYQAPARPQASTNKAPYKPPYRGSAPQTGAGQSPGAQTAGSIPAPSQQPAQAHQANAQTAGSGPQQMQPSGASGGTGLRPGSGAYSQQPASLQQQQQQAQQQSVNQSPYQQGGSQPAAYQQAGGTQPAQQSSNAATNGQPTQRAKASSQYDQYAQFEPADEYAQYTPPQPTDVRTPAQQQPNQQPAATAQDQSATATPPAENNSEQKKVQDAIARVEGFLSLTRLPSYQTWIRGRTK